MWIWLFTVRNKYVLFLWRHFLLIFKVTRRYELCLPFYFENASLFRNGYCRVSQITYHKRFVTNEPFNWVVNVIKVFRFRTENLTMFWKFFEFLIIFSLLDANFDPYYLARLFTDCFEIFRSDDMPRDVVASYFTWCRSPSGFELFPLSVKFNDFFCRMGLALTMTVKVSKMGWFESRYIEMLQDTFHLIFKSK